MKMMKQVENEHREYNSRCWLLLTLTPYHRLHLTDLYFETGPTHCATEWQPQPAQLLPLR